MGGCIYDSDIHSEKVGFNSFFGEKWWFGVGFQWCLWELRGFWVWLEVFVHPSSLFGQWIKCFLSTLNTDEGISMKCLLGDVFFWCLFWLSLDHGHVCSTCLNFRSHVKILFSHVLKTKLTRRHQASTSFFGFCSFLFFRWPHLLFFFCFFSIQTFDLLFRILVNYIDLMFI